MKFTVSSQELLHALVSVSRVVPAKPSLPMLANYLLVLKENELVITASDAETTLKVKLHIDQVEEEGEIALPAKLLTDSLKEFPEQPITFETKGDDNIMNIVWASGASQVPYFPAVDYPELPELSADAADVSMSQETLLDGINNTLYATGEEELRPVMNGIFFDMGTENTTFVASDAHKLVCFTTEKVRVPDKASFILHKKPAMLLKGSLMRIDDPVQIKFDGKNAYFEFEDTVMACRLIEGNYPAYRTVIPKNNENKLYIARTDLLNAVKRVAVWANQASNFIKLKLSKDELVISAQDLSFQIASHEKLNCQYDGDEMEIGFKATFLTDILSNLPYDEICIMLADSCRAILIVAAEKKEGDDEICSLLMPLMINA
ncbi:MAG: DNA polymerase III subunit beta [Bacteroidales bacterium]|jgi:DNA polymerase-3 subunit beta|nr:DNA polymerase III subunit beta [Bacteroidales bacterium]MCI2121210.1 DNA polymerase III subunit beta [Bacteroidales bacterium]MCI2146000.1 DNA polymerase III subunit beta [Bacteroidales bacterium]